MALLKVHLLLVWLGVSVNSVVSLQKRIIGGHDCDDKERLYHVRLERSNGQRRPRCGASLIHPEWILTAAHCFKSETGWYNVAMLKVHPRTATQQEQVIVYDPVIYADHLPRHDIMLLKLRKESCCFSTAESGNQATSRTRTWLAQVCWTRDTCKGCRTP